MPYRRPAAFDPDRARRWLLGPAVVDDDGQVRSWHNPRHPGYRYPEAAGLLLSLFAIDDRPWPRGADPTVERIAGALLHAAESDALGRDGSRYLFDEGIALAGLVRYARHGGEITRDRIEALQHRFVARLEQRQIVHPECPARWSTTLGPHLLKLAVTVGTWPDVTPALRTTLLDLSVELAQRCDTGRFITAASPDEGRRTYLHAHCYAVEGALRLAAGDLLDASATRRCRQLAEAGASWLATVQRPGGGLPAWHDGATGWGPEPADVAAQAVRLWALVDRAHYASAIERALGFLARLTAPSGALRYHGDCRDENTWATIFAVQAAAFARDGGDARGLV